MSKVLVSEENLTGIANAIREKNGSQETYTPSEMVTAISNISGGGTSTDIKKMSQINRLVSGMVNYFDNYVKTIPDSYEALTDENITLYTPDIGYKDYMIQKRNSGKYRAVWFNGARRLNSVSIFPLKLINTNKTTQNVNMGFIEYTFNDQEADRVFYTLEQNTIEDCIELMKSRTAQYNSVRNYLAYVPDTPTKIPFSNTAIYYYDIQIQTNDEFIIPKKISSNETILQA